MTSENLPLQHKLSRRERQIMDVLFQQGECSAQQVREGLPDAPGYSAVRALLARLQEKGAIRHRREGQRYLYAPTVAREEAQESALDRMLKTFFDGSAVQAVNALLGMEREKLSERELEELEAAIERARRRD